MVYGHTGNEYSVESWDYTIENLKYYCFFFLFFFFSLIGDKFGGKEKGGGRERELNADIETLKRLYSFIDASNLIF